MADTQQLHEALPPPPSSHTELSQVLKCDDVGVRDAYDSDDEGSNDGDDPGDPAGQAEPEELTKELIAGLVKQIEFYLSDANLPTDKKLLKQIKKDPEGFVPVKLFSNFRKVRALSKDVTTITKALHESKLLMMSDDNKKVRRRMAVPKEYDVTDIQKRTVVVENLPLGPTIESVTEQFKLYGQVKLVRICSKESKGKLPSWLTNACQDLTAQHAYVEFETEDAAILAAGALCEPDECGSQLLVRRLVTCIAQDRDRRSSRSTGGGVTSAAGVAPATASASRKVTRDTSPTGHATYGSRRGSMAGSIPAYSARNSSTGGGMPSVPSSRMASLGGCLPPGVGAMPFPGSNSRMHSSGGSSVGGYPSAFFSMGPTGPADAPWAGMAYQAPPPPPPPTGAHGAQALHMMYSGMMTPEMAGAAARAGLPHNGSGYMLVPVPLPAAAIAAYPPPPPPRPQRTSVGGLAHFQAALADASMGAYRAPGRRASEVATVATQPVPISTPACPPIETSTASATPLATIPSVPPSPVGTMLNPAAPVFTISTTAVRPPAPPPPIVAAVPDTAVNTVAAVTNPASKVSSAPPGAVLLTRATSEPAAAKQEAFEKALAEVALSHGMGHLDIASLLAQAVASAAQQKAAGTASVQAAATSLSRETKGEDCGSVSPLPRLSDSGASGDAPRRSSNGGGVAPKFCLGLAPPLINRAPVDNAQKAGSRRASNDGEGALGSLRLAPEGGSLLQGGRARCSQSNSRRSSTDNIHTANHAHPSVEEAAVAAVTSAAAAAEPGEYNTLEEAHSQMVDDVEGFINNILAPASLRIPSLSFVGGRHTVDGSNIPLTTAGQLALSQAIITDAHSSTPATSNNTPSKAALSALIAASADTATTPGSWRQEQASGPAQQQLSHSSFKPPLHSHSQRSNTTPLAANRSARTSWSGHASGVDGPAWGSGNEDGDISASRGTSVYPPPTLPTGHPPITPLSASSLRRQTGESGNALRPGSAVAKPRTATLGAPAGVSDDLTGSLHNGAGMADGALEISPGASEVEHRRSRNRRRSRRHTVEPDSGGISPLPGTRHRATCDSPPRATRTVMREQLPLSASTTPLNRVQHAPGSSDSYGADANASQFHAAAGQYRVSGSGSGGKDQGAGGGKGRMSRKDYAAWAAATPGFRAEATALYTAATGAVTSAVSTGMPLVSYPQQRVSNAGGEEPTAVMTAGGGGEHHGPVIAKGPDGTRGFAGRGRALPSAPN